MEQPRISSTQTSAQQAGGATRARAAGPGDGKAEFNGADAGGFLALLAAVGNGGQDAASADPALLQAPAQRGADTPAALQDAGALAAWQGLLLAGAQVQPENAGLSAAHYSLAAGFAEGDTVLPGVFGRPQGLVAETALLDTAADLQPAPHGSQGPGSRPWGRWQGAGLQQPRAEVQLGFSSPSAKAVTVGEGMLPPSRTGDPAAVSTLLQGQALTRAEADVIGAARGSGSEGFESTSGLLGAASAGNDAAARPMAGGAAAGGGSMSAGANTPAGIGVAEAFSADAALPDGTPAQADPAAAMAAEEQVAEQVAYWVHQKTQNAELTVHRDGEPMEVSVSLSGNEAHVSFRSDQAQTRDMLDRSMAQLGDLLQREGLMLSGMSVGTSAGQGRGNADQQRPRDGARQAQVSAAAPAGTAAAASTLRGGAAADRTVDVFV